MPDREGFPLRSGVLGATRKKERTRSKRMRFLITKTTVMKKSIKYYFTNYRTEFS
jgi:hypothetical protein